MLTEYVDRYFTELQHALVALDRPAIWAVVDELIRAWRQRRQIFLLGNGGSAALASHMANDLNKLASVPGQPRLRAVSLVDNVPLITAWANDADYEEIFAEPLRNHCQPGDVVVAISCSGNSRNVLKALDVAKELGARTIGFTGDQGGQLREKADLCLTAPVGTVWQQEDIHLILNHLLASTLRQWLAAAAQRQATPPKALVLAAGEGTRLRPLTLDVPKPMVPINGKPALEYTIAWLRGHGICDVAINLHHRPEAIIRHVGDGAPWGLRVRYSREEVLLGTAGAVRQLNGFLENTPLIVVYGDVLTDLDLQALVAFHDQNVARDPATAATLSLYRVTNPTEVGLVELDRTERITRFVEKPSPDEAFGNLANAGVLVIEPWVVEHIPPATFYDFGMHLLPKLLAGGYSLYGWTIPDGTYLIDFGTPEKYAQAQREWPLRHRNIAHEAARHLS